MSKSAFVWLVLVVFWCSCKSSSTNPLQGEKLRLITSDQDTTSAFSGTLNFTVTVLDPSGYGVHGAYLDFYDPIQKRSRHEGPTPQDGTIMFADTIEPSDSGGTYLFSIVAESAGVVSSDSLKLWVHQYDIGDWTIDSIFANSWDAGDIGLKWKRPAIDQGNDTVFVSLPDGQGYSEIVPYPQDSVMLSVLYIYATDTITIRNAYETSRPFLWAPANYSDWSYDLQEHSLYELADTSDVESTGYELSNSQILSLTYQYYRNIVDLVLAADSTSPSGLSIMSPSITTIDGHTTRFYHPVQFIDNGNGLHQLYYSGDLSTFVNGVTPMYKIPLPDSSKYSTAFIAVTASGNYAQVEVGPVTHDGNNFRFVAIGNTYQPTYGLPYAGRARHR